MMRWVWILVLAAGTASADGAVLRTRDGKTYNGDISVSNGQFAVAIPAGPTARIAPADVASIDFRAQATEAATTEPTTQPQAVGSGLRGEYFSDCAFHHLAIVRGDPWINFDFAPPRQPINNPLDPAAWQRMSVRWTGRIQAPATGRYTFFAPDGSLTRLWIDHRLILDVGQTIGSANLEAGKQYDFRVDWVGHHYLMSVMLEWASPNLLRQVVSSEALFPPTDDRQTAPNALITTPAEGIALSGPVDVPIKIAVQPGSSAPVQVTYCDGETPIGTVRAAPFDFNWAHAPIGDHEIIAKVTNADGTTGSSAVRHVVVGSAVNGTLPKPWLACDVPAKVPSPPPHPKVAAPPPPAPAPPSGPLSAPPTFQNNTLTLNATGGDVYSVADQFQFVFQRLEGDGSVVARVADVSADQKAARPLAGVMVRTALTDNSRYAALLTVPTVGDVFLSRHVVGGEAVNSSSPGSGPIYLKLTRKGYVIRAYRSADGQKWEFMGETTLNLPPSVLVGVIACGGDPAVTATASFDHFSVATATADDTHPFQPTIVLTDGTRLVGTISKMAKGNATLTPPAPPSGDAGIVTSIPQTAIARVFYRPVSADALGALTDAQTGVFLNTGDFYEGEIDNVSANGLAVNSVVFGPRDFNTANLSAIILRPVAKPSGVEVDLSDGSSIQSPSMSLPSAGIELQSAAGEITVALKNVERIVVR